MLHRSSCTLSRTSLLRSCRCRDVLRTLQLACKRRASPIDISVYLLMGWVVLSLSDRVDAHGATPTGALLRVSILRSWICLPPSRAAAQLYCTASLLPHGHRAATYSWVWSALRNMSC